MSDNPALEALRRNVTGRVEAGLAEPITEKTMSDMTWRTKTVEAPSCTCDSVWADYRIEVTVETPWRFIDRDDLENEYDTHTVVRYSCEDHLPQDDEWAIEGMSPLAVITDYQEEWITKP